MTTRPMNAHSSIAEGPAKRPLRLLAAALLIAALAYLALGTSPTLARASAARCASHAAHSSSPLAACAQRRRRTHAKRRHRHVAKHKRSRHGVTVQAPAISSQTPAVCEDGSSPALSSEGFSCADGSEPSCANGAEPVPAEKSSTAVCPTTPGGTVNWSEAECADGSTPTMALGGGYACEDGSQPVCQDGSAPVSSDSSTLSCIAFGPPAPAPAQGQSSEEGSEDSSIALAPSSS
ncbi:MAG: hypothetical protein ACYDHT_05440 [Solirubrobacteraceae bacterium]